MESGWCQVVTRTYKGKSGTVQDLYFRKIGHITITVFHRMVTILKL